MADYSLAAQIRPPQFADPLQTYAQMQQLQTNMLAAQRLRQNIASENELRNLFRGGKFDLESPELAARIGAVDPDMAFKVLQAQRQAKLTQRQAETEERRQQESLANIAVRRQELILKHGDTFRQALGRIESFPETERPAVYEELRRGLPADLQSQFPARYSPTVVQRGMMTTDQLIAAAQEARPKYQELPGNVPGEYVPGQGVRPLNVLPAPGGIPVGRMGAAEQAGVPSYPVPAARQAAMTAAAQRYAPELMGAAPVPAPAPAPAAASPFGGLAAPTAAPPMTGFDLARIAEERKIQQEGERTLVREQAQADVKRAEEERTKGKVKGEFQATLDDITNAYRDLGRQGALITPQTPVGQRLKTFAASQAPGITGVVSPEMGAPIQTIENLRQSLVSALMGATGMSAKQIDSNAEMKAYLNSLTSPGQTADAVVKTFNSMSRRFGLGKTLTVEDLTGAKTETPPVSGRRGAAPPATAPSAQPSIDELLKKYQ